jgi:hypothetical protein
MRGVSGDHVQAMCNASSAAAVSLGGFVIEVMAHGSDTRRMRHGPAHRLRDPAHPRRPHRPSATAAPIVDLGRLVPTATMCRGGPEV